MVAILSWACSAIGFFLTLYLIRRKGVMEGGRPVWVFALLVIPVWFVSRFSSMTIDARTLCALALIIGFLMQPVAGRGVIRWYFSDLALAMVCASVAITQFVRDNTDPMMPVDKIAGLVLPYFVGRLFLRSPRDIETILPAFSVAITILGLYAFVEGLSRKNPIEIFLGRPWLTGEDLLDNYDEVRWGLKRAYGPQKHPIYLGLTLAMVMPWAIEAAVRSWNKTGPWWWRLVPFPIILGIISTGSRAAQISVAVVLVATFFQVFRKWRWTIVLLGLLAGATFEAYRDDIIELMDTYISEKKEGVEYVIINGVKHPYTGTLHRDLLFLVFEEAIDKNDWLGYGANTMDKIPTDPDMDSRFKSIDNHFLLWFLQYGYLGLTLFAIFAISIVCNLLPPLLYGRGAPGRLAGGLFGAMVGSLIAMRAVWFAPDYAWVFLFCGGLSTCLSRLREPAVEGATPLE